MSEKFTLVVKKFANVVTIDCESEEHRKRLQTRYEMKGFTRVNKEDKTASKMSINKIKPRIESCNNSVKISANRRRIEVGSFMTKDDNNVEAPLGTNAIAFKALVTDVGVEPGIKHELSACNRIKKTVVFLTDEALVETYLALKHYFETGSNHAELIKQQYHDEISKKLETLSFTNEQ